MGIAGNSMLAGNLGAVETVVAWMFENSACEGLQERACAALQKFTTHDIDNDNEIRARKVGGIGAVSGSGVARALHKDSGKVPHPACAALRKLTGGNAEGASWAGNVGAIVRGFGSGDAPTLGEHRSAGASVRGALQSGNRQREE